MDLNLLAGALRGVTKVNTPGDMRGAAGATRIALSLQALLPVIESQGASQFASDVRALVAEAARGLTTVFVVQPAGSSQLRLEVDRHLITVPPTLRDAVLALAQDAERARQSGAVTAPNARTTPPAQTVAAPAVSPTLTLGVIAGAQSLMAHLQADATQVAATGAQRALRPDLLTQDALNSNAIVRSANALLDGSHANVYAAARQLRATVEHSGLFYESHLAQWSAGTRSAQDLGAELTQLHRQAQATPSHEATAATASVNASSTSSGERVAAQLETLQKSAFVVQAPAWAGQPCSIAFHEDLPPEGHGAGSAAARPQVVSATVTLDLPHFGPLHVQLRLAGAAVAVQAQARPQATVQLSAALGQLGSALQARGLEPVALTASALTASALTASALSVPEAV